MDLEGLVDASTDVWLKGPIQRYEERPAKLEEVYLAEFMAWYTRKNARRLKPVDNNDVAESDDDDDEEVYVNDKNLKYRRRDQCRVIRYRFYEVDDVVNYKREMVLLYVPFRSEVVDILDRSKFVDIFEQKQNTIMERCKLYNGNINIKHLIEELRLACDQEDVKIMEGDDAKVRFDGGNSANNDDIEQINPFRGISAVRKREGVMPKQQFCEAMRKTNAGQREFLLEIIHRLHDPESEPIQVFFTGPAGSGKTFVLRLAMEIYNRYSQKRNSLMNSYLACGSTGKAASAIGAVTIHSAFRLTISTRAGAVEKPLDFEMEQTYRGMFDGVRCVIVDEVSMVSSDIFRKIDSRLKQITGAHDMNFGGLHVIFCGDLRQLPPVRATPVFKCSRNVLGGPVLWQSLNYYPLKQVMRQKDSTFAAILTKIGCGIPLDKEEIEMIDGQFRTLQWCLMNLKDTIYLFHENRMVDQFNTNIICNPDVECVAVDVFTGYRNDKELAEARTKLHQYSVSECAGYPYLIRFKVGYPYMVTANIDVEDGLVNGVIGILQYIERLTEDRIAEEEEEEKKNARRITLRKQNSFSGFNFNLNVSDKG